MSQMKNLCHFLYEYDLPTRHVQFSLLLAWFPENLTNNWDLGSVLTHTHFIYVLGISILVTFMEWQACWVGSSLVYWACVGLGFFLWTLKVLNLEGLIRVMTKRRHREPIDFFVWTVEMNSFSSLFNHFRFSLTSFDLNPDLICWYWVGLFMLVT